jgi:predicted O-methyltransferase YrrM
MTGVDDALARAATVDGWMSDDQGRRLYDAAARCPPGGRIVEIGSFRGRSTIVLAAGAADSVEVVAIDPHAGNDRGPQEIAGFADHAAADRDAFRANLERAGVAERVRHVAAFSSDAHGEVDDPIDVLYIDGAHRYRPASDDVHEWGGRVMDGGTLLIHDAFSSIGVTAAVGRHLVFGGRFRYVGRSRSLVEYRADLPGSGIGRRRNAAIQLAQLGWFVGNVGLKVALELGYGRLAARLGRPVPEWPY